MINRIKKYGDVALLNRVKSCFRGKLVVCAAGDESSEGEDEDGMVREVRGGVEYTFRAVPRATDEGLEEDKDSDPEEEGERYATLSK